MSRTTRSSRLVTRTSPKERSGGLLKRVHHSKSIRTQDTQDTHDVQDNHRNPRSSEKNKASNAVAFDESNNSNYSDLQKQSTIDAGLYDFLDQALEENRSLVESHDKMEKYLSPVFQFTRTAKGHPALGGLEAEFAASIIDRFLLAMGYGTSAEGWTSEFVDCNGDEIDARALFIDTWPRILFLVQESWLDAAWRRVENMELRKRIIRLPQCASEKFASFLALAAELQQLRCTESILLPCREVAELMKINKETVSTYRRIAVRQRFLVIVKEHTYSSSKRESTEFKFDQGRLEDCLEECEAPERAAPPCGPRTS